MNDTSDVGNQAREIHILPVRGLPEVQPGDDLAGLIARHGALGDGDVVVVSQKVVSKAEGRLVTLPAGADDRAGRRELALRESVRVVVATEQVLIVETAHGFVCANAGVDASNVEHGVALLPVDPDASAREIRSGLAAHAGVRVAVVVTDTFGRPWRTGQTDVAIGVAGLAPLRDERGGLDRAGRRLEVTQIAVADEVAAAADLARRKADGVPVVVIRGLVYEQDEAATARQLVRAPAGDLFRRGRGELAGWLARGAARQADGTHSGRGTNVGSVPGASGGSGRGASVGSVPAGARVSGESLEGAVAAARGVGGPAVQVDAEGAQSLRVSADSPLRAGAAAAALVAALADLDREATIDWDASTAEVVVVRLSAVQG